ncbi:acyl-Coenzyme A oxidase [Podila horticola]|nr:acyl-Coenzyme A oxidase [Podila horticola]
MESRAASRLSAVRNHLAIQPWFQQLAVHNDKPTGPAELARERAGASFQVDEMTEVVYRGKDNVRALKLAYQLIQRDPDLRMSDGHGYDQTRAQDREQTMRQIARLVQLKKSLIDPLLVQALFQAMGLYSASFSMRIYVHELLFRMAISLFGTAEQQDRWIQDLEDWRIIGFFAMTELGHSSNLRGLETTSTFDRATDEFVLHSPTLTSSNPERFALVRYGAVRRQGDHDEQNLDYQTHYTTLTPGGAFTYMLNTVDKLLFEKWDEVAEYAQTDAAQFMREIPDQHGVAAGFKGVLAWYTTEVLEVCRRASGGHAYSSSMRLPG